MSEKISIQEAGKSRNFSGVGVIETETPEGDSVFWVPESERELESEYVFSNGTYRPRKYGFSDIDVDVFDRFTDLDGNDWEIKMPDIGFPDITLDLPDLDIDFTIDDTGDIDIHIPGGDPGDWPGWGDLDPDTKGDFDDWWEDDKDPDDWPGWGDLDPDTKGDFDDWINDKDYSFDPSEFGIDPNSDVDISLDVGQDGDIGIDLVGVDMDGDGINVNIDLDDLDIDIEDCPEEIRVMHVPSKTEYTDGHAIDYDGLVVQAFDKDGNVWTSKDYPDGYIPVNELSLPQYADMEQSEKKAVMPEYMSLDTLETIQSIIDPGYICDIFTDDFPVDEQEGEAREKMQEGIDAMRKEFQDAVSEAHGIVCYAWCGEPPPAQGTAWTLHSEWCGVVSIVGPPDSQGYCPAIVDHWGYVKEYTGQFSLAWHQRDNRRYQLFQGIRDGATKLFSAVNAGLNNVQSVDAEWTSPCLKQLSSSFDVVVDEKQDYGGSHSSGKF